MARKSWGYVAILTSPNGTPLSPLQKEKRRREIEHQKREGDALERKKFEVC